MTPQQSWLLTCSFHWWDDAVRYATSQAQNTGHRFWVHQRRGLWQAEPVNGVRHGFGILA